MVSQLSMERFATSPAGVCIGSSQYDKPSDSGWTTHESGLDQKKFNPTHLIHLGQFALAKMLACCDYVRLDGPTG